MKLLIITQVVDRNHPVLGFFTRWLDIFAENVESLQVICLQKGDYASPKNTKVFSLGKERGVSKFGRLINFYKYIWQQRKNYDVVFVHMNPIYVVLGSLIWHQTGKKIGLWYMHKHIGRLLKMAEKRADYIFTGSKESFRLPSKKLYVLGHGIEVETLPLADNEFNGVIRAVTIGRISKIKGYDTMIDAVAYIKDRYPEQKIYLQIIGGPGTPEDQNYLESLKDKAKKEGLGEVIKFLGPHPHHAVAGLLRNANLFINLSDTGSLDKAVLEAMACGLPALTSNPAFTKMLSPYDLMIDKNNIPEIAKYILETPGKVDSKKLREVVSQHHSLSSLIPKIIQILSKNGQKAQNRID